MENICLKGKVNLKLLDKNGNIKDERNIDNLIVRSGLNFIASRMINSDANVMTHMAIGSGTNSPFLNDTTLSAQINPRKELTLASVSNSAVTYTSIFDAIGTVSIITEAAIFNDISEGTMLCRTTFNAITQDIDDVLAINWTITVGA
jgi:hypothetical protein